MMMMPPNKEMIKSEKETKLCVGDLIKIPNGNIFFVFSVIENVEVCLFKLGTKNRNIGTSRYLFLRDDEVLLARGKSVDE